MKKAFTLIEALVIVAILAIIVGLGLSVIGGCENNQTTNPTPTKSATGVRQAQATVETGSDGLTVEQRNITRRLEIENLPGSIKHLYIISAMSGDILLYSTVDGKVTSSSKRLTPYSVYTGTPTGGSGRVYEYGDRVNIGGESFITSEILQDDGTYGSSTEYLYWWDVEGVYHQQYITGGMLLHISDQPIDMGSVTIQVENDR